MPDEAAPAADDFGDARATVGPQPELKGRRAQAKRSG